MTSDTPDANAQTTAPLTTLEQHLIPLLGVINAAGPHCSANDDPEAPIAPYCGEGSLNIDTYNLAIDHGLVDWSHDSDSDNSVCWLTAKGKALLARASSEQTPAPGLRERIARAVGTAIYPAGVAVGYAEEGVCNG